MEISSVLILGFDKPALWLNLGSFLPQVCTPRRDQRTGKHSVPVALSIMVFNSVQRTLTITDPQLGGAEEAHSASKKTKASMLSDLS